jgi:MFS family permease
MPFTLKTEQKPNSSGRISDLAVFSMVLGMVGLSFLLFAHSVPRMLGYAIVYGLAGGIQSIAMGNLFPDYFGRSEFPKIMGNTMPFNTILSSLGAPLVGFIRDRTGSYVPAFKLLLALLAVSFFCIVFAKPPLHPSLKDRKEAQKLEPEMIP